MDKMLSLSKRRGFIFQSSEIYGGLGSTYDYGPLGVELKRNVKEAWWRSVVRERDDVVGLDSAILMHPKIWEASGHVENFTDPLVECRNCHLRFRPDHQVGLIMDSQWWATLGETFGFPFIDYPSGSSVGKSALCMPVNELEEKLEHWARTDGRKQAPRLRLVLDPKPIAHEVAQFLSSIPKELETNNFPVNELIGALAGGKPDLLRGVFGHPPLDLACPSCGATGAFTEPRRFNLMFRTFMGPVEDSSHEVFLRPETAQGIFVNFKNVLDSTRKKLPFGIAQVGKAFRNEITPGNFTFRTREFEQMEVEFFVKPGTDEEWLDKWVQARFDWYVSYGIRRENLRLRRHDRDELAHYARDTYDIEYRFPWGWGELEGIADRTDFDLRRHEQFSGEDLTYFDEETRERYLPYVIEPSGGVDRATLAFWLDSYDEEPDGEAIRTVLHLHRNLAPVTVAVLPLSRNDKLVPTAQKVYDQLRKRFSTQYDDAQSIGRRYRRQDEIGTPYCVTVDFDTLEDHQVTIRDRDTMHQHRVAVSDLAGILQDKLEHGW
ncbi:MAG TPA: glycine--tRNA ligase [Dehalococcoidia bacterium]|nr:glycine--tRNA ligase [Dehalococcoidia bacterium]